MQRRISSLKSFCKFALKEQYIDKDFMIEIKPPKSDFKLPVYMNMNELKTLLLSLEKGQHRFALRNELVSLTWGQLDFFNQTIRVFGKGKKKVYFPFIHLF